jgi:hypothetical protein
MQQRVGGQQTIPWRFLAYTSTVKVSCLTFRVNLAKRIAVDNAVSLSGTDGDAGEVLVEVA